MKKISEVSALTGISVRTLRHYDAIGLLKPTAVSEAGYRMYDDEALARLRSILLFRELEFPLREIKTILDDPEYDASQAIERQIELLELKKKHIEGLIDLAKKIQKGEDNMSFKEFDKSEIERYEAEAKEKWGSTPAYRQYESREKCDPKADAEGLMMLFAELGVLRGQDTKSMAVQEKISEIQRFITQHFYDCTDEIFLGLGEMYVADGRMCRNIDAAGGEGTAEFARSAIRVKCRK